MQGKIVSFEPLPRIHPFVNPCRVMYLHTHIDAKQEKSEVESDSNTPVCRDIKGKVPLYAGINNVRFKQPVRPGDTIEITAKITNRRGPIVFVEAFAEVNGKRCVQGDLSFALIDKDKAL